MLMAPMQMKEPDLTEATKSIQLGFAVTGSFRIRLRMRGRNSEAVGWIKPGGFIHFVVRF